MRNKKVFILERIDIIDSISTYETLGVYSTMRRAKKEIETLPKERENMKYEIREFELNGRAIDKIEDLEAILKGLMDKDLVDQLVDENGDFVYTLTQEGKKVADDILKKWGIKDD